MSNIKTIYVCDNCGLPVQGVYIKRYYPEIEEQVFPIQCEKCGAFFDGIILQMPKIIEVSRERRANEHNTERDRFTDRWENSNCWNIR